MTNTVRLMTNTVRLMTNTVRLMTNTVSLKVIENVQPRPQNAENYFAYIFLYIRKWQVDKIIMIIAVW